MLFTGPTGTGKTELATAIAEYLYGDQSRSCASTWARCPDTTRSRRSAIGGIPTGLLTSRVRAQPFCVVLARRDREGTPAACCTSSCSYLTRAASPIAAGDVAARLRERRRGIMTSNLGLEERAADRLRRDARAHPRRRRAGGPRVLSGRAVQHRIDQGRSVRAAGRPRSPRRSSTRSSRKLLRPTRPLRERNTFVYAGARSARRRRGRCLRWWILRYGAPHGQALARGSQVAGALVRSCSLIAAPALRRSGCDIRSGRLADC